MNLDPSTVLVYATLCIFSQPLHLRAVCIFSLVPCPDSFRKFAPKACIFSHTTPAYGSLSVRVSPVSAAAFSWACWAGAVFLYSFKAQTLTSQADHKVVTQSRTQAHDSRQQLFHHLPQ